MAVKVIRAFRERFHDMKLYKVGDDYPNDDQERVQYLAGQGFLEVTEDDPPTLPTLPTLEEFVGLSAADQKKLLTDLGIEGDGSNAEKREALYRQYLGFEPSAPSGTTDGGAVNNDADPNA